VKEFNQIMKERAPLIKKSILEPETLQTKEKEESTESKESNS